MNKNMPSRMKKSTIFSLSCLALLAFAPHPGLAEEQSLSLKQAFELALEHSDQIQSSREDLQQAQGDVDIATSKLYPQISARAEHMRQKDFERSQPVPTGDPSQPLEMKDSSTPDKYNMLTLSLDQHVYQMGKLWSGRRLAKHYYEGARSGHLRHSQQVLFQVASKYYEVLLATRSIEIAQDSLKRARQQQDRAQALLEAGMATETDMLRAKVLVAQAREQLEQAKNDQQIAREDLALEIGLDQLPPGQLQSHKPQMPAEGMQKLQQIGLKQRHDLDQARKALQAEAEGVEVQRADFFPRLSLHGQYSRTDEEDIFEGDEKDEWQASVRVSYPLFTGGERKAKLEQARSKKRQSRVSLARLEREVKTQVRSAYLDIQTREQIVQHLEEEVQAARSNYRQVLAQYEQGLATSVDLIDAQTAFSEAQSRLAQSRFGLNLDLIRLQFALGTLEKELVQSEEGQS
ncbi:MAG: TolC family protein [Desulfohalobiaceae bacterium]